MKTICYLIGAFFLLNTACTEIEDPTYDNPNDPLSPEFLQPSAVINPSISSQPTYDKTDVKISWTGVYEKGQYAYMLKGRDADFSNWSVETSVQLTHLDEGEHTFYVKEKYGDYEQNTSDSIVFTVDAVKDVALLLKKWESHVAVNTEEYVELTLENFNLLKGLSLELKLSDNMEITRIEKSESGIDSKADSYAFLSNEIGAINDSKQITIDVLLLGGADNGFSGNATLCRIYYKAKGGATISFNEEKSIVRNTANEDIAVALFRGGIIEISE